MIDSNLASGDVLSRTLIIAWVISGERDHPLAIGKFLGDGPATRQAMDKREARSFMQKGSRNHRFVRVTLLFRRDSRRQWGGLQIEYMSVNGEEIPCSSIP